MNLIPKSFRTPFYFTMFMIVLFAINALINKSKSDKNATLKAPVKEYILFDSTLSINSPFPISKDTIIPNKKALAFNKILDASYYSDNITLNLGMYQYRLERFDNKSTVLVYREMAESYLKSEDRSSFWESHITEQSALDINGKKFTQLNGVRKCLNKREYADYLPKHFTFLINDTKPNLYFIYFEENINTPEFDTIKARLFTSIKIKNQL